MFHFYAISDLSEKQEIIPIGCLLLVWKPYLLLFQLLPPDVALGEGGPKWTSLNSSPVIITRCHKQGGMSDVRGCGGRGYPTWPFLRVGYPTMGVIPWCIWCYIPPPPQKDAYENITTSFAGGNNIILYGMLIVVWSKTIHRILRRFEESPCSILDPTCVWGHKWGRNISRDDIYVAH